MTMKASRIRARVDSYTNWHTINPTLLKGEIGFITDEVGLVIGDGQHNFDWLYANAIISNHGSNSSQNAEPVVDYYTYNKVCDNSVKYVLRNYGDTVTPNFYIASAISGTLHQNLSYSMSISNTTLDGTPGNLFIESGLLKKRTVNTSGTVYIGHKSVSSAGNDVGVVQHTSSGVWIYNMYNGYRSCLMTPYLLWRNPNIHESDTNYAPDFTQAYTTYPVSLSRFRFLLLRAIGREGKWRCTMLVPTEFLSDAYTQIYDVTNDGQNQSYYQRFELNWSGWKVGAHNNMRAEAIYAL